VNGFKAMRYLEGFRESFGPYPKLTRLHVAGSANSCFQNGSSLADGATVVQTITSVCYFKDKNPVVSGR